MTVDLIGAAGKEAEAPASTAKDESKAGIILDFTQFL